MAAGTQQLRIFSAGFSFLTTRALDRCRERTTQLKVINNIGASNFARPVKSEKLK